MAESKPGRGSDQFPLRLPDGMRDQLKVEAEKNGRSMNAEIVQRLGHSLEVSRSLVEIDGAYDRPPEGAEIIDEGDVADELARALSRASDRVIRRFMTKHGFDVLSGQPIADDGGPDEYVPTARARAVLAKKAVPK